jgi:hypothetical protein
MAYRNVKYFEDTVETLAGTVAIVTLKARLVDLSRNPTTVTYIFNPYSAVPELGSPFRNLRGYGHLVQMATWKGPQLQFSRKPQGDLLWVHTKAAATVCIEHSVIVHPLFLVDIIAITIHVLEKLDSP